MQDAMPKRVVASGYFFKLSAEGVRLIHIYCSKALRLLSVGAQTSGRATQVFASLPDALA